MVTDHKCCTFSWFQVPVSTANYSLIQRDSASIVIVISGHASAGELVLKRGTVIFLPSNELLNIHCGDSSEALLMFQAMCNV
jgi:mannose-6-phosphate isomerase class I